MQHVYAALKSMRQKITLGKFNWSSLDEPLKYKSWVDLLTRQEYDSLRDIRTHKHLVFLKRWLAVTLPKYRSEWERLGNPVDREEWLLMEWMSLVFCNTFSGDNATKPVEIEVKNTRYNSTLTVGQLVKGDMAITGSGLAARYLFRPVGSDAIITLWPGDFIPLPDGKDVSPGDIHYIKDPRQFS